MSEIEEHVCKNGITKKYSSVLCSICRGREEEKKEGNTQILGYLPEGTIITSQKIIEEKLKPLIHLEKYLNEYDNFPIGGYDSIHQTLKNFGLEVKI